MSKYQEILNVDKIKLNKMEVYILYERDGYGVATTVLGVFSTEELAFDAADKNNIDKKYMCVYNYKLDEFEKSDYL